MEGVWSHAQIAEKEFELLSCWGLRLYYALGVMGKVLHCSLS